jgi:glutaredoxin
MSSKKDVISFIFFVCLGVALGFAIKSLLAWHNTPPEFIKTDTSAHFAKVDHKVILYSTSWCPACKMTRELFEKHNIDYLERDIEIGDEHTKVLFDSMGEPGVPKIVFESGIVNGYIPNLILSKSS